MSNVGVNKLLHDRRHELGFSTRKVANELHISRLTLYFYERGYFRVNKKYYSKFIELYDLPSDFFEVSNVEYPTPIEKPSSNRFNGFIKNTFGNKIALFCCAAVTIGFSVMFAFGVYNSTYNVTHTLQHYSSNIAECRQSIFDNHDGEGKLDPDSGSMLSVLILDKYYYVENTNVSSRNFTLKLSFFSLEENVPYTFINGYKLDVELPEYKEGTFNISIEYRTHEKGKRVHFYIFQGDLKARSMHIAASIDINNDGVYHNYVKEYESSTVSHLLEPDDPKYIAVINYLDAYLPTLINDVVEFFKTDKVMQGAYEYTQFENDLISGTQKLTKKRTGDLLLLGFGVTIATIGLALFIASLVLNIYPKYLEKYFHGDILDSSIPEENKGVPMKQGPPRSVENVLGKNIKFSPFIPEFILKILVIVIYLLVSILIAVIFEAIDDLDIITAIQTIQNYIAVKGFTSLALILVFFMKLDINQSKKLTFITNYIMFFVGFLFYMVLVVLRGELEGSSNVIAQVAYIGTSFLPGNIVWGILVFNLLFYFLFTTPDKYKNNPKALKLFRSFSIFPLLYLLTSLLYIIGQNLWDWNWPYEVSSLFFSKSIPVIVFSVIFCFAIFIYKRYTVKKYGEEYAPFYQQSNKYIWIKNGITVSIIAVLGIIELMFHLFYPKNPLGLGKEYYLLLAIPLILLYRPHIGKRNKIWDMIFPLAYGTAMVFAYVLIAVDILSSFIGI